MRNLLVGMLTVSFLIVGPGTRADTITLGAAGTYTKNSEGRIETATTVQGTTRYSYFDDGLIREVVHPDGSRDTFDHDETIAAGKLVDQLARDDRYAQADGSVAASAQPSTGDPFETSGNRFGFTGHYFDRETGLYYAKARYYDPQVGRFTTQDSQLGDFTNPPSLHRYMYGRSNPARFIDPTGHSDEDANRLAAGVNQRTGLLASDHRPADQRSHTYNVAWELYKDLPPRLLPMRQLEGLGKQDAGEFALGTAETMVAAASALLVEAGAGALVDRFPVWGKSVTGAAREAIQRIRTPVSTEVPPVSVETVPLSEAAPSSGAFVATEEGRLAPVAQRLGDRTHNAAPIAELKTAVVPEQAVTLSGPKLEHLNASIAELHGYGAALDQGHVPIRSPGKTTATGADYVTYDPVQQEVVLWDSKYRGPQGGSVPKTLSPEKIKRWTPEAKKAIEALPDSPVKAEMLRALDAGQVRGEIFKWPK